MHSTPPQAPLSHDKNDDLDLLVIARNVIVFFKKNSLKLALTSLVGLFCGIVLFYTVPKYYTSRLLIESSVLSNTEAKTVVENWDEFLRPGGYPYLMKDFNCSREMLRNTIKMVAEPLNSQNENLPGFILTVSVRDTSKLQELQTALLNGFNGNDYVRRRVEQHKQAAIDQIRKTDEEMSKLDSTKQFIEHTVASDGKDRSPLILDVSNLSAQKVALLEKKAAMEEKLEFVDGVLLIQGFSATKGPKPGLMTFLAVGLVGGFLIGYVWLLFRSLNRNISTTNSN